MYEFLKMPVLKVIPIQFGASNASIPARSVCLIPSGDTNISTNSSSSATTSKVEETGERKIFACDSCPKSFLAKHSLKRHVKEVSAKQRRKSTPALIYYSKNTKYDLHG